MRGQTHQYGDIHPAFVWKVIHSQRHNSEFDSITGWVAGLVGLNEAGDISGAEVKGGSVGEKQTVPSVAPHRQVEEGILIYKSDNLQQLYEQFQQHVNPISVLLSQIFSC